MPTALLGSIGSTYEGRRPSAIGSPPTRGEIKKLRDRLLTYGRDEARALTEEACEFIAAAVASPQFVRAQLNRPNIRPTATGHLEVVYATVPIDCLVPDPGNGRVVGATAWPASDAAAGQTLKLWSPSDLHVHATSNCEVVAQCDNVGEFKRMIEDAADRTKQLNPKMKEKVERDGILDPLLCQLLHIETIDGHRALALVTRDGSTRCSFAKEAHRALPHDALFGPARDLDYRRTRWTQMKERLERPADQVTYDEMIELRTFLVDIQIVVGFASHDAKVAVLDAVDDIVRRTHVETSLPWLQVAQDNSQADQVLHALHNHDVLDHDDFLVYGGKLSRDERVRRGLPAEPDVVFADLVKVFGATATRGELDELHTVVRRATGQGQIRTAFKATLAGSLGLRQFAVAGNKLQAANTTLAEALRLEALWDEPWENTNRSPDELCSASLDELEQRGEPGAACRELVVKAAGHLAAQGWLKAQISGARGLERDQRQPSVVLDAMHRTAHGIEVLAEALEAGRRGVVARALVENGTPIEQASGDVLPLSNEWLRTTFNDGTSSNSERSAGPIVTDQTPRERVAAQVRRLERAAIDVVHALDAAERELDDNGSSYLERAGWSRAELAPIGDRLRSVDQRLERLAMRAEMVHELPPVGQVEQLGIEALEKAS